MTYQDADELQRRLDAVQRQESEEPMTTDESIERCKTFLAACDDNLECAFPYTNAAVSVAIKDVAAIRHILAELAADRAATTDEPRGCACPGQCAAIADLAAERAARETAELMVQKEQRISTELRRIIMDRSRSLDACEESLAAERAAKEAMERSRDSWRQEAQTQRQRYEDAIRELDEARERLAQVEEDAAAMRRALREPVLRAGTWAEHYPTIKAALATNAGKPLLDEVARLRELCRRSLGFVSIRLEGRTGIDVRQMEDLERRLRAALADGGKPGPV